MVRMLSRICEVISSYSLYSWTIVVFISCEQIDSLPPYARDVSAGAKFTIVLTDEGSVWTAGNYLVQLLGNDSEAVSKETPVEILRDVVAVSAGLTHALMLKKDGTLWAMGRNEYGQLGDGTSEDRGRPIMMTNHVRTMAAGFGFSVVVKTDGTLWTVGQNNFGQLGRGEEDDRELRLVMKEVLTAKAGYYHVLVVKNDHSLWGFGSNIFGALGMTTGIPISRKPVRIFIKDVNQVVDVAAGSGYSLCRTDDNLVYAAGLNHYQTRADTTYQFADQFHLVMVNVKAMAADELHCLFLTTDNVLYGCGNGADGQLGNVDEVLDSQGNTNVPVLIMTDVTRFDAGGRHSVLIKNDRTVWMMGNNNDGQFGNYSTFGATSPLQVFWEF